MDYKKKYEQALENLKRIKTANEDNKELVNFIEYEYPELKKSEDERIRKAIIKMVSDIAGGFPFEKYGIQKKEALAWLEKQGKQKPTDKIEPKFKVGDIVRHKNGDNVTITQIDTQHQIYYYKGWDGAATVHSDFSISEQDNWELVEQKPTWSEEDEVMLDEIIDFFENGTVKLQHDLSLYASWLKSIKEIYTWKPSDEQIQTLEFIVEYHVFANKDRREDVIALLSDLKKLMEE